MTAKRALLSVSDKTGLVDFGRGLAELGWELVSTGGTARTLREAGLEVMEVAELTGFPEILGGRVKTLHPAVHGGILARRTPEHLAELEAHGIAPIDLVVVNLYPFEATVAKAGVTLAEAVEEIDIGGVTLLRAAAKNYAHVGVVSDPGQYPAVLDELRRLGKLPLETRQRLALAAFRHTARYDAAIGEYLERTFALERFLFPAELHLNAVKLSELRYGENPHQHAALYSVGGARGPLGGTLLQGKELSYNNLLDLDAAWRAAQDFQRPTVAIIKHTNPCGLASGDTLAAAFPHALAGDPVSAFGSVIACNRPVDEALVAEFGDLFIECIAAPDFTPGAQAALAASRKNCRLVVIPPGSDEGLPWEVRAIRGGLLVQDRDAILSKGEWKVVTQRAPTGEEMDALRFAWAVGKHVKSNAIVLVRGEALVGVGAGQMSRVDAVHLAVRKAGSRAAGTVLGSDAFFPHPDGVEEAARAGVTAIVQPGGSRRDAEAIAAADEAGMAMLFTGVRHFRH